MSTKQLTVAISVLIVVGAGAFYGGIIYEKGKLQAQTGGKNFNGNAGFQRMMGKGQQNQGQGANAGRGGMNRPADGEFVSGEITAKDDQSVTVKTRDGSSKIIYFSDTTTIGKATQGTTADLEVGKQVMINGKSGSEGTLAAQNIQIRPEEASQSQQ